VVSALGIENPRRRRASECPGGALVGASRDVRRSPAPAAAAQT
jgi:hypothetical protein